LRVGEVRALRMLDVDMKARTLTVNQAVYEVTVDGKKGDVFDRPKGRTRRTVPMSKGLHALLRNRLPVGYVVGGTGDGPHGKYMSIGESRWLMQRLAKRAGLGEVNPFGAWHILRHTFATHAALFGANPWTLNQWLGHKSMEETMLYVSLAKSHAREVPPFILAAGEGVPDPDRRLRAMLDARALFRAANGQRSRASRKRSK
jgi:integrase